LFLLRHAKSSWADPALPDQERPLTERGERSARRVATYLESELIRPELVLCSSARRARDTLDVIRPVLPRRSTVQVAEGLYGAGAAGILDRLRAVDADVDSVMVIGHNPGLEDLARDLAGDGDEAAMEQLRTKFPTAALACFDVSTPWVRLHEGHAFLTHVVPPRRLPDEGS